MEENNDFLNQKQQNQKPTQQQELEQKLELKQSQQQQPNQKKKASSNSNDSVWGEKIKAGVSLTNERKHLILKKIENVKKILLDRGIIKSEKQFIDYSEYKELPDYMKYCLVSSNYWHVMNSNKFVNVPIEDTHFWFYFDERCFDLCAYFQKIKNSDRDELLKYQEKIAKEKLDIKPIEPEINNLVKEPKEIIESEVKLKSIETEMPIEENKDFLKQKQEHPVYPKRENIEFKKEPSPASVVEIKKKPEVKTKKTTKNNNNEEQGSLF